MHRALPKLFIDHGRPVYEGVPASMAIGMALLEVTGVRSLIDRRCRFDRGRRTLTPGMAVKAMIAPTFNLREKDPLYVVEEAHRATPTDRVFDVDSSDDLDDDALGQALDTLAELDLRELYDECCRMCMEHYGFVSYILHGDSTNFSVRCIFKEDTGDGTAVPRHSGHPKDLHRELMQYCLQVVTDSNRVIRYMKPYSGNVSDYVMNKETLEYIGKNHGDDLDKIVYVADSKLMSREIMSLIESMGIGFASPCPENFGGNLRARSIAAADAAGMAEEGEYRFFDTYMDAVYRVDNRVIGTQKLRCIVHRDERAVRAKIHAMSDRLTEVREAYAALEGRDVASTREGALKTFRSIELDEKYDYARVTPHPYPVTVPAASGSGTQTVWRVRVSVELDEEKARDLAIAAATGVLVTNLPRSKRDQRNPRLGLTARGVLALYANEYKVEHTFRLLKSGMGMDSVFLQNPSRENTMMFVLSIAGLMMSTADAVLRRAGDPDHTDDLTMYKLARRLQGTTVEMSRDRDRLSVRYAKECKFDLFEYTDMLGINPQFLLGYVTD